MIELIKKWIGPALVALILMTLYQIFVAPSIRDMMDDWSFLHQVRVNAIQQQQQRQQKQP